MKVGDKVIKNVNTWIPSDFDSWGRGIGIGEVIFVDYFIGVQWNGDWCDEDPTQLINITNRKLKLERILNIK